jgi:phenylalanyl-tRNA synthetase beta chain
VELKQSLIQIKDIPEYQGISKYPSVRRDLALILDEKSHVNEIVDYISKQYSLVNEVIVFDIYQGKGVESGRKSVALGLILQDKSKTLVEQDVEQLIEDLLNKLDNLFNARLRE